jgi:hypothetical protein
VIHLTTFGHTGNFGPGTTILDGGRIIWSDDFGRPIESRLLPQALAQVKAQLEASDALDRSGNYSPELRPGAQPPGHGASGYVFDLVRDGEPIVVAANDRTSFEGEGELWIFPPEMDELSELGRRLSDPVAWLGADAFTKPIRPYQATTFLVEIHLYPTAGGGSIPDVDDVRWPFGEPIERVGAAFDSGDGGPDSRCLLIDAALASLTVAAEQAAGMTRNIQDWESSIDYEWPRVGGFVTVELTHVLPYETGTCAQLATTPP